ncbi:hypothetical protein HRI_000722400 [Hibiscus trionum]|uniref:Gag1-like clamp domain-containing protein n=1 Tax=Hibiscus trionum TaxID=183268 RepID=A0A9W7H4K1_HIBTR|nr:hypothetical protein HRI_000722400 [Hibiscus trionum]
MEANGSNHHFFENRPATCSNDAKKGQCPEKEVFVNHAEITWHEVRRLWVGDQSQKSKRMAREPIMRYMPGVFPLLFYNLPAQILRTIGDLSFN